jgi:hypothetical protein
LRSVTIVPEGSPPATAIPPEGYDWPMKKFLVGLLILTVTFGLGVVAYRAMTVEVPVEDPN